MPKKNSNHNEKRKIEKIRISLDFFSFSWRKEINLMFHSIVNVPKKENHEKGEARDTFIFCFFKWNEERKWEWYVIIRREQKCHAQKRLKSFWLAIFFLFLSASDFFILFFYFFFVCLFYPIFHNHFLVSFFSFFLIYLVWFLYFCFVISFIQNR